MNLCDLTKNIYVINLKRRRDRLEHIEDQLEKIGCDNYKLIEAVDGHKQNNPTKLSNGMYGLVLTYFKIFDKWIQDNDGYILIIEDDCVFLEDFNSKLETYLKNVPENWDMIYFGGNHNGHVGYTTLPVNDFCVKLNNTFSAHCVLLKDTVFVELIDGLKNFEWFNDVLMARLQSKYNAYSSIPNLTTQLPSFSNIEDKFVNYEWLIK